ncbi:hypothetical protein EDB86DRAFT_2826460 [Lactarius hatsudake]|nr:hypothetical protein EDB86DRAFT_2826460 [Lactarius hatsudake]
MVLCQIHTEINQCKSESSAVAWKSEWAGKVEETTRADLSKGLQVLGISNKPTAATITYGFDKAAQQFSDYRCHVVCTPSHIASPDLTQSRNLGPCTIAGLQILGIINEPTAAAVTQGLDKRLMSSNHNSFPQPPSRLPHTHTSTFSPNGTSYQMEWALQPEPNDSSWSGQRGGMEKVAWKDGVAMLQWTSRWHTDGEDDDTVVQLSNLDCCQHPISHLVAILPITVAANVQSPTSLPSSPLPHCHITVAAADVPSSPLYHITLTTMITVV